jgi:hypothetical protein
MSGLVVYATRRAAEDAARLLPGRVLETAVENAICAGRKRDWPLPAAGCELRPGERFVIIDSRVGAVLAREDSGLR